MQDNAKIHKARTVMRWFDDNGIQLLEEYPPYSPDLNPIEQLWPELKIRMNDVDPELLGLQAGEEVLQMRMDRATGRGWLQIPADRVEGLIRSMDTRINAVIEAKGWYTRY